MKSSLSAILFWFAGILGLVGMTVSCKPMEELLTVSPAEKIVTGPGPEDMVLDTLQGDPRLIISCSARRDAQAPFGEIMSLNLKTGTFITLVRYGEPEETLFRPHGIYLDGDRLWVISHEQEPDLHPIMEYRIRGDSLQFVERILTPSQHSPNALVQGEDGSIYFVNDSGKRGSILEKALKLRRASLVRLTKSDDGHWESEIVARRLGYPAGINRIGDTLFVGDAILHRIHVFSISEGKVVPVKEIKDIRGADNIRIHNGQLLIPGHIKPFKFIRHTSDPSNLSPVAVFSIDPVSDHRTILYYTDGSAISAGSTALVYGNDLYVSQVFESYILKVRIP